MRQPCSARKTSMMPVSTSPGSSINVEKRGLVIAAAKSLDDFLISATITSYSPQISISSFDSTTSAKRSMRLSAALWPSSV